MAEGDPGGEYPGGVRFARDRFGGGFLMWDAYSLDLLNGNVESHRELRPGYPIPFGGKLCPVKPCAAPIVANRSS